MTSGASPGTSTSAAGQAGEPAGRGRIVVGVDGSQAAKEALRWAAAQAARTGADVHVVTAWEAPVRYGSFVTAVYDWQLSFPRQEWEKNARAALAETVAETLGDPPSVTVTTALEEGQPAGVLLRAADGADLLVVGSTGHGAFSGLLLGSVSDRCVRHAPCPVVVVPGPHRETPVEHARLAEDVAAIGTGSIP